MNLIGIIGYIIIAIGIFFILSSIIGLIRLPDFFTKIHASSIADSLGIPLCLFGLAIMQNSIINTAKILVIIILFFLLGPTSNHALIKAAWIKQNKDK